MMTDTIYSDLPIPPGEYLEEVIEELGMSKNELARRMSRPASKLSPIFKGKKAITPDTALQLEKVVGIPAYIWSNLEADYRLTLARQQEQKTREQLKTETSLITQFCYASLANLGVVPKSTKAIDKVIELQKFFGVTSLHNVKTIHRYAAAFRCGKIKKQSPEAVASWLRLGELMAQKIDCAPFNKTRLKAALTDIRRMTTKPPDKFILQLKDLLSDVGIALVICPHLPKTYAYGATFALGRDKTVLMLSVRDKWADIFWFSFFHELGHIFLHDRNEVFVAYNNGDPQTEQQEKEADVFAANTLIPPEKWSDFIQGESFYPDDIKQFAHYMGIDAGIVVGRLQHEGFFKPSWRNDLRIQYDWAQN